MFNDKINIIGKHADMVRSLEKPFFNHNKISVSLFEYHYQFLINAPIIGFLYGEKGEIDKERKTKEVTIFKSEVDKYREDLEYTLRLLLLLDDKYIKNKEERFQRALKSSDFKPEDFDFYYEYLLGGIQVLYRDICEEAYNPLDYIDRLSSFLEEISDEKNNGSSNEEIRDLCRQL